MVHSVAGIGLGQMGQGELEYFGDRDDCRVVAGVDPDASAREWFDTTFDAPVYRDIDELLSEHTELDVANIASPHADHYGQVRACLDAGVDVHVEKPMVTSIEDGVALVDATRDTKRIVQVGYQRHFDPRFRTIRELIEDERIGRPRMAHYHMEQSWLDLAAGTWKEAPKRSGGGFIYDSGSHLLDALLWTTDARPREVAAITDADNTTADSGPEDVDLDGALSIALERDDGRVIASVGTSGDGPSGPAPGESLRIVGTDGVVAFDGDGVTVVESDGSRTPVSVDGEYDFGTLTARKLEDFLTAVRGEKEPAVPPETALWPTALTEAAIAAAERSTTVDTLSLVDAARSGSNDN